MITVALLLALMAAGTGDARGPAEPPRWDRLRCFAYAPAANAYACFDFDLGSDDMGPQGIRAMDFERWVPPPDTAWTGHKSVRLVGASKDVELSIAVHPYGFGRAIVHRRSAGQAMRQAAARGFSVPVPPAIPLVSGRWVEILGARLRFTTRYHLGDASEYSIGSLQVDCRGGETSERLVELLEDRRGASAVAFVAPGAASFVVGVMKESGGEGSWYVETQYVHVDPRRVCAAGNLS